ncbi:acyl-CoA thioesterase [Kitasatospora aureofaciens]|uniref:acyl-CoA thioesterase n=1 Tax=Kitasatospora aureofaciens TaxID=1894 RepID=UPI0033A93B33
MTAPADITSRTPADSAVTLAHIMSEHDTNLYGTVHGGVVMKLIDDAAAAAAGRHAGVPAVTVSVEEMTFLAPVRAGDLLTVRAQVDHAGRTSMDVTVAVTAERWNLTGPVTRAATAHLVFVAVDADGQPHRVPALHPATPADRRRQRQARARRHRRATETRS